MKWLLGSWGGDSDAQLLVNFGELTSFTHRLVIVFRWTSAEIIEAGYYG